MQRIYTFEVI